MLARSISQAAPHDSAHLLYNMATGSQVGTFQKMKLQCTGIYQDSVCMSLVNAHCAKWSQRAKEVKKNSFESILMRWMKLEPIIQSEVSQKDKDHYNILTHIYGI